ncbi:sodium:alanine symporter family protein [Saccharomonospora xinjiangensis]|uniref:alanine/glycine:cation symporter family protein n=1 Tax=Saccharomonospora xinjiangensis TaxID=75294 RepID=UPI00106F8C50|nr:sodium:alanine symporter family protein [Saccharomonospora xinjiangensis]QBQ60783.1 Amino-acid carrier protein AlsT [Saccharomonospora xinjiangensis]
MEEFLAEVSSVVWGPFLLIPLLLGTGLYLTVRLGGVQFLKLVPALRLALFQRKDEGADGDISHYQALTTALAATVGVGNIAGVATAIYWGGPGALFWMWVTALVGMASKYSEAFLAVRFRTKDAKGDISGGPQYYLAKAIPNRFGLVLSIAFAVFAVLASFGIGNMTQSNTVAVSLESSFGVPAWAVGVVVTLCAGAVLLGGIKWIGKVTAAFVPFMIIVYVLGALAVLLLNVTDVPAALGMIFTDAFTGTAATGGFLGSVFIIALQYGVARGIFSNESGLGSAAIAAAAAQTRHPVRQALVAMTQTFIDTIIVVTMTGLVIVTTGTWKSGVEGAEMTADAFTRGLPGDWGHYVVTVSVVFFAFSTMLGWAYYGERCVERLVGVRGVLPYRLVFTVVIFVGATTELSLVWTFSDVMNGLMALPNLIGLVLCAGLIARETKQYLAADPDLLNQPLEPTLHGTDVLRRGRRDTVN